MSEEKALEVATQVDPKLLENLPSAAEVEKEMVERALKNPLDTHAQLFYMYLPRFNGQINFMSKKQLITLMDTLVGSEYNKPEDINKLLKIAKTINLKGLIRVIANVVEHPLHEVQFKLMNKKEQDLFHRFDTLLSNKYLNGIKIGLDKNRENNNSVKEIEDVIIHTYNKNKFKSRENVEKDAFATSNKLLASKYLMMLVTTLEFVQEEQKKEELNESKN